MTEKMQVPLLATKGAPVIKRVDVTKFIEQSKSISSRTGSDTATEDNIATLLYYYSESFLETIEMINLYGRKKWVKLNTKRKDTFRHIDSQVYM